MGKIYKSRRNGKMAELVQKEDNGDVIMMLDDGSERHLAASSFKRWWRPAEDAEVAEYIAQHDAPPAVEEPATEPAKEAPAVEQPQEVSTEETPVEEPTAEVVEAPAEEVPAEQAHVEAPAEAPARTRKKSVNTESKPKRQVVRELPEEIKKMHENFMLSAQKLAETANSDLFKRATEAHNWNFRKDGAIYLWFALTRNGVIIRAKSKAIGDKFKYEKIVHNYDARIFVDKWDANVHDMLYELHQMSLTYQLTKKQSKKEKAEK